MAAPPLRLIRHRSGASSAVLLAGAAAWAWLALDHGRTPFDREFDAAARATGVPANLLRAIGRVESGFNPKAKGGAGELGVMQLLPATAKRFGVAGDTDPARTILAAARYLAELRGQLGPRLSLFTWPAAYNAGPDLEPRAASSAYAAKVGFHWLAYDAGRVLA